MEEKFSRKRIKEFMECMADELFKYYCFTRKSLCDGYKSLADKNHYPTIENVEDEVNFINALTKYLGDYCKKAINSDTGERCLSFYNLDPCNIHEWNAALEGIYTLEQESEMLDSRQRVRLIANAPEMYKVLKKVSEFCKSNDIGSDIECDIWEVLTLIDTGKQAKI